MRERMETSFGHDFSAVRIHEGPQAEGLGAIAYTQGQDIHFAPGKYRPSTHEGRQLIGHELTHVVQQRAGRVAVPQGKGAPINSDPHLEDEADHAGAKAARGEQVAVQGARRPGAAITAVGTQRPQPPRAPGRLTHSTGAAAAPFQLQPDDKKKGDPKFYIQPPKVGGQALKKEIERMHKSGAYSHPDQIYANLRSEGYESAEIMHHLKDLK